MAVTNDLMEGQRRASAPEMRLPPTFGSEVVRRAMEQERRAWERKVARLDDLHRPEAGHAVNPHLRFFDKTVPPAADLKLPRHPWELYQIAGGWAVYPASVNGTIIPTVSGSPINTIPVPLFTADTDFDAYVEFDLDADSIEGIGGLFYLLSGSQELSNVEVTTSPSSEVPVSVDSSTGIVTSGHYAFLIGSVVANARTAQTMRFSTQFTLCSGGGISVNAYG